MPNRPRRFDSFPLDNENRDRQAGTQGLANSSPTGHRAALYGAPVLTYFALEANASRLEAAMGGKCECPCECDWEPAVIMGGRHLCRACFNGVDWSDGGLIALEKDLAEEKRLATPRADK